MSLGIVGIEGTGKMKEPLHVMLVRNHNQFGVTDIAFFLGLYDGCSAM
jgi:hypothetical protein